MSRNLTFSLLAVAAILFAATVYFLQKGKISLKYSLLWFCISLILFCCSFLPGWLICITGFLGFQTTSNLIIGILFVLLFVICMILTIMVSSQNRKITLLIQEVSILKSRMNGKCGKDE